MTDLDIAPLRPLQLGVVTGTEVAWVAPADPVRVRGADLGEVARRASAARRDHPHSDVVVDIDFVIAHDARSARALTLAGGDEPDRQTLLYVGTPAGLAGLIADIHALNILGTGEVRVVAPKTLLPADVGTLGVHVFHDLEHGLRGVDVVIMLRLQRERMSGALLPSASEYFQQYGLTAERLALAQPDAIVMHPGPINRGIEMDSAVVDGPRSVILEQVTHGIAVRMAVMAIVLGNRHPDITEET